MSGERCDSLRVAETERTPLKSSVGALSDAADTDRDAHKSCSTHYFFLFVSARAFALPKRASGGGSFAGCASCGAAAECGRYFAASANRTPRTRTRSHSHAAERAL